MLKNRIKSEARNFSDFLDRVWDKKLWILSTSIFLFAFGFVIRTYLALPEQFIQNTQKAEMVQFSFMESNSVKEIFDGIYHLLPEYRKLFVIYDEYYGGKALTQKPSEDVTKQAGALCKFLRQETAKQIGKIQGIRLATPDFVQFRDNILESIQKLDALVGQFEKFFQIANHGTMNSKRDAGQNLAISFNNTLERFISAVKTSNTLAEREIRKQTYEMESLNREMNLLFIKFYLTIPALIYVVLYMVFACAAYLNSRKPQSPKPSLRSTSREKSRKKS